jgi:hypothetical protein
LAKSGDVVDIALIEKGPSMKPDSGCRIPVAVPVVVDRARFIRNSKSLSILLSLLLAAAASAEAILSIQAPEEFSVEEGVGEIVVTITRGGDLTGVVSVDYRTVIGTATAPADFTAVAGTARFEAGVVSVSVRIPIVADTRAEGLEAFRFILLRPSPGAVLGTPDDVRITIIDDAPGLHFVQSHYGVAEDGGEVQLSVSRSQEVGSACRVDFATQADTASAGTDFASTTGTLVFAAGERTHTICIPILNDGRHEGSESFRVQLSNPSAGAELGTPAAARVTIEDNDIGVGFSAVEAILPESQLTLTVVVVRGGDDTAAFTVDYATADDTARAGQDYVGVAGTLEFGEGENSKTLTIQFLDDVIREWPEHLTVQLSNPSGDRVLGGGILRIRIEDDDPGVGFADTEVWVNEANPTVNLRVLRGSDDTAPFTVDYATVESTARAGEDFVAAAGTLEFAEGEQSKLLVIELINDGRWEGLEWFLVELENPSEGRSLGLLGRASVMVRIEDNDVGVGFAGNEMWVNENQGVATLTVRRGSDSPGPFTVQYATANGTAQAGLDYVAASGTVEFGENDESQTVEIELLNDAVAESEETFTVRLSNPSAGRMLEPQNTVVTVRIGDNDRGVGFVPSWVTVREDGGLLEVRLERQTDYTGPFQVAYTTQPWTSGNSDVGSATSGQDYVQSSGVLEFAEGENLKTLQIEILNDATQERGEEFQLVLSNVTGAVMGIFEPRLTMVIEDNDPGIHFDPLAVSVLETEPQVVLTVHRGADSLGAFTVDYATRAAPDFGAADYLAVTGTIAFGEGEQQRTLTLPLPGGDAVWEGDEEFEVVLSLPTGVGVLDPGRSVGTVVVIDDEAPVRWEAFWVGEPFPEVWDLRAVTWGGGRYVAVGGEWAVVSEDGRVWTARAVSEFGAWDVIWADDEYLAAGDKGVWRSADGLTWDPVGGAAPGNLFRLSHDHGVYVALDREGRAWMTADLVDWSSEMLGPNLQDVVCGDAGFVVVGDEGKAWHGPPDGEWTALGKIAPGWLGAVAWGEAGYVTACGQYDEQRQTEYLLVMHSPDGRNWQTNRVAEPVSTPNYLVYGGGAYAGVSWNRVVRLVWEDDHWVAESSLGMALYWFGIGDLAYGGASYIGTMNSTLARSDNALVWERLGRLDLRDIQGTGGRFFVEHRIGDGWHGGYFEIRSSADGKSWALEQSGGFRGNPGAGLAELNGVVGYLRGGILHLRAQDGTWRAVELVEQGWLSALAAGFGHWVVMGRRFDELAQRDRVVVYRSVDGENWETHFPSFNGDLNRLLRAGDWLYATGNEDCVGEVVMQSTDGLEWQRSPLSGEYELYGLAYGRGIYVAAARGFSNDQRVLLRSADGFSWTVAQRLAIPEVWSADVEYGGGLYAVTWQGWQWESTPQRVTFLSRDGLDWRRHTPWVGGSITALDYADGRFLAAGPAGLVLRSQPLVYLGAPHLDPTGQLKVWLEAEAGREYAIEGSPDLIHWRTVGIVVPVNSEQEVVLPVNTREAACEFYRLTGAE